MSYTEWTTFTIAVCNCITFSLWARNVTPRCCYKISPYGRRELDMFWSPTLCFVLRAGESGVGQGNYWLFDPWWVNKLAAITSWWLPAAAAAGHLAQEERWDVLQRADNRQPAQQLMVPAQCSNTVLWSPAPVYFHVHRRRAVGQIISHELFVFGHKRLWNG